MNRTAKMFLACVAFACISSTMVAQVSVIGELSQDREVRPGDSYEGVILVKNDTDEMQEAKVYQSDYAFHFSGTNSYGEPGTHPRSNARWISFSPQFLSLPPQSTAAVNYRVAVPRDSLGTLIGTYWSMLMVEGVPKGSLESSAPRADRKEMGIAQAIRYGIQIASTFSGTGTRNIKFIETKLVRKDADERALQIDIENTGEIGMRPDVYVELFDEAGLSRGRFYGIRLRLYPGTSVRQVIDLSSAPSGTFKALIVVDAGADEAFAAQYTLKL
ncbi:MAG: hypothetical protein A3C56_12925 [Ignavibacteria bacterium RIFCSPHIGHO2_02_FULL_56_12]|nr:MAG: hypothetical protein A3C56_12925 [Ignavibacteria bacterium RIFCSPHIGHO2_02_FULL_56_12]